MHTKKYKPPFQYFGGKSKVAHIVWSFLGDVENYVEPFFGSGALLFLRPTTPQIETVNDIDGYIANFWRAVQHDPAAVAHHCNWPINENDLEARHKWLVYFKRKRSLPLKLKDDPDYFDAKIAGWWVWGLSQWIGRGWCAGEWHGTGNANNEGMGINVRDPIRGGKRPQTSAGEGVHRKIPNVGGIRGVHSQLPQLGAGQGVHSQKPYTSSAQGIHAQRPHLGPARGVERKRPHLSARQGTASLAFPSIGVFANKCDEREMALIHYFLYIADRLRDVRVCCGDWKRVLTYSPTTNHGMTGVFLDPPYADTADRSKVVYSCDDLQVAHEVRKWAIEAGKNPLMRICLAGYEGEHKMPDDWRVFSWKTQGGMASTSKKKESRGKSNRRKERLWFSPACIQFNHMGLFT